MSKLANNLKDTIILHTKHQNIIAALNQKIEKLEKELLEIKNIEIQHQKINGLLHEEVKKLKAEIKLLKEENRIIRKG
jgi:cell division protein FtsB